MVSVVLRFFLTFIFSAFAQEERADLKRLDEIMLKAGSVEGFVRNPAIQEEYYRALVQYMGGEGNIPRPSFNRIVGDLRDHLGEVRGLGERLWETTDLGTRFTVELTMQSFGRQAGPRWKDFFERHKREIQRKAGSFLVDGRIDKEKMARYARRLNPVIAEQQKEIAKLDEKIAQAEQAQDFKLKRELAKSRGALQGEFQKKLNSSPLYQSYAAALSHHHLSQEYVIDLFGANDADVVIDKIRSLRQFPTQVFADLPPELVIPNSASEVRKLVPEMSTLLSEKQYQKILLETRTLLNQELPIEGLTEPALHKQIQAREQRLEAEIKKFNRGPGRLFPITIQRDSHNRLVLPNKVEKETIVGEPLPRRIHGIWKGIKDKECIGGHCDALHSVSIERWATVALKKTQLHAIEKTGVYQGFTQIVPMKVKGQLFGSVDWGASILRTQALTDGQVVGKRPLVEIVIEKLNQQRPEGTLGLIMGESSAVNNSGVRDVAIASRAYKNGDIVGTIADFEHLDKEMAHAIVNRPVKRNSGYNYDGNMAFDASVSSAGKYTRLTSDAEIAEKTAQIRKHLSARTVPTDFEALQWLKSRLLSQSEKDTLAQIVALHGKDHTLTLEAMARSFGPRQRWETEDHVDISRKDSLAEALLARKEAKVDAILTRSLSSLKPDIAHTLAQRAIERNDINGMKAVLSNFAILPNDQRVTILGQILQNSDPEVSSLAVRTLKQIPDKHRPKLITPILNGTNLHSIRTLASQFEAIVPKRSVAKVKNVLYEKGFAASLPESVIAEDLKTFLKDSKFDKIISTGILDRNLHEMYKRFSPGQTTLAYQNHVRTLEPIVKQARTHFETQDAREAKLAAARLMARYTHVLRSSADIERLIELRDLEVDKYLFAHGRLDKFADAPARRAAILSAFSRGQISLHPEEVGSVISYHSSQLKPQEFSELLAKAQDKNLLKREDWIRFFGAAGDIDEQHWPQLKSYMGTLSDDERFDLRKKIFELKSMSAKTNLARFLISSQDQELISEIIKNLKNIPHGDRSTIALLGIKTGGRPVAEIIAGNILDVGDRYPEVVRKILETGVRDVRLATLLNYPAGASRMSVAKALLETGSFDEGLIKNWKHLGEEGQTHLLNSLSEERRIAFKLRLSGMPFCG